MTQYEKSDRYARSRSYGYLHALGAVIVYFGVAYGGECNMWTVVKEKSQSRSQSISHRLDDNKAEEAWHWKARLKISNSSAPPHIVLNRFKLYTCTRF